MSIKDYAAEVKTSGLQIDSPDLGDLEAKQPAKRHKLRDKPSGNRSYIPLLACMAIALVTRTWLAIHTQGFINGDEALVGIQAEHILHGEFPIYFYNQPYMGSLEAYLMALIFAIVGPSVWALRAEPILLSLGVVWLTWQLAAELAQNARLSPQATRWFMSISALLAAIPPLYDTVLELTTLGGYIEIFLLMLLLLLFTLKLTRRRAAGASSHELAWRWAAIGFIVGLGFWINPIIIYAILAAAPWIGWDFLASLRRGRSGSGHGVETMMTTRAGAQVLPAIAALPACIVGLTPALAWGISHQWANFTYLLYLNGNISLRPSILANYPTRLDIFFGLVHLYSTCVAPRVTGGALPGESSRLALLQAPTLLLSAFCILAATTIVAITCIRPRSSLLRIRRLVALPLLFAACTAIVFCVTKTAAPGLWSCQYDLAGRYATPLMLALPFLLAAPLAALADKQNDFFNRTVKEIKAEQPHVVNKVEDHASLGSRLYLVRAIMGALVGMLFVALYMQVFSYGLTNAGSTFQSPYCTFAPANNDAIIDYMKREHIQYAWAPSWIAYPIVFKTQSSIILADPLPFITHNPMLNRIPANSAAVIHADRPSLITFVKHDDHDPELLQFLDNEHITYRVARFPAQEGRDVIVVTPLNRTVSPLGPGPFFNIFICSRDS
jgi:hypothetical protein